MIDLKGVGNRVKAVRMASGLTAQNFAETFGCDQSAYSKIEQSKKGLSLKLGANLAGRWGVSLDYIYRGRLNNTPENILDALRQIEAGQ